MTASPKGPRLSEPTGTNGVLLSLGWGELQHGIPQHRLVTVPQQQAAHGVLTKRGLSSVAAAAGREATITSPTVAAMAKHLAHRVIENCCMFITRFYGDSDSP